jgi:hypothetical protein
MQKTALRIALPVLLLVCASVWSRGADAPDYNAAILTPPAPATRRTPDFMTERESGWWCTRARPA